MMFALKEKRPYSLQRDFRLLEREQRVTKILGSHAFRTELEGILQGQLDGSRSPPKLRAIGRLQDNVMPATAVEAAHRGGGSAGLSGLSSVLPINDLRGARASRYILSERQLRCKLASLCRLVDWFGWSQLVENHVSAQGMTEREEFLMNPFGLLYGEVTASSLVRVNNEGTILDPGSTQFGVTRSGVDLHSAIYGARRDVKCIIHLHTVAGTAISAMGCGLLPISEEAISLGKVSYYKSRWPLTSRQEKKELARTLGKSKVLILRNHGLIAVGSCVEECFHIMYNLIQACQIQVAAISAGIANLMQVPLEEGRAQEGDVGGAKVWTKRGQMAFEALMRMLDNKGYQTGYRYCGLHLLQSEADSPRAAWDDVVEGGVTDTANRQRRRRGLKMAKKDGKEVWSFLDDNRSRDKPLTKNTKIRVRCKPSACSVSPVPEEVSSRDPWDFLTSRDSSKNTEPSKASGGSSANDDLTVMSNSTSRSHRTAGKRRLRRRKSHSTTSPHHTSPAETSTSRSHTRSTPVHAPAVLSPPPNLTSLQMAQYTAERVAHSTGMAVQKLALHRLRPHTPERTLSEPDLTQVTPLDHIHRTLSQQPSSYHFTSKHLDSQGYSSGDEASYILTHSPSRPGPTSTTNRHPSSPLKHSALYHSTEQYCSESEPLSGRDETTSPTLNTTVPAVPFIHAPANISYPKGYSSAEKAAYVARLVADSTGTAVQKLSETISERTQLSLSLSSGEHPSPHAPSLSPLTDN